MGRDRSKRAGTNFNFNFGTFRDATFYVGQVKMQRVLDLFLLLLSFHGFCLIIHFIVLFSPYFYWLFIHFIIFLIVDVQNQMADAQKFAGRRAIYKYWSVRNEFNNPPP